MLVYHTVEDYPTLTEDPNGEPCPHDRTKRWVIAPRDHDEDYGLIGSVGE